MNDSLRKWIEDYPNFRQCSIQTFNEQDKNEKSQSRILPMTDENLEKCEKLQDMMPYGVYFSVNPMESGKRDKASVKFIQTWICDIDTGTKEEQIELIKNAPLQPTFVVESVHGFHLYYFAVDNLTEEQFANGNRGLRNYYNGDPKVCTDTARVLRIPGFYHQKGEKVMVVYREDLSSGCLYGVGEMEENFPNQTETTPGIEKQRKQLNSNLNEEDSFRTRAGELDSKMMLEEFSGTGWVSGDTITFKHNTNGTEQIYVNNKSTGCWIDKNGLIGSGDKGGPTRIQWLKRYGLVDRKELAKEIKRKHPELEERKVEKIDLNKFIYKFDKVPELKKPDFTRGDEGIDNAIGKLSRGQFIILCGETGAGKTTFATFMARKNKNSCYYVLEDSVDNIAKRYAIKWAGITREEYNNRSWSEEKNEKYNNAYKSFKSKDLNLIDVGNKIKIEDLLDSMRKMKEKGCGIFFIDNLGFVIGNGLGETDQTADISSKIVSFCLEENVCVVLLHHFKKKAGGMVVRDIGQMRGSGKLGDDATMVVEYVRDDLTFLVVYKDRMRGELKTYQIGYNRGDFVFVKEYGGTS